VKVSLIATVKDAAAHVGAFLDSVAAQTRPPDEIVIVDGGSTDGTWEVLEGATGVLALSEPGSNIAWGRAAAIDTAAHDVIAVTDADCVLDPVWLERLLEPIERGADVSAGFYRPLASSFLEVCAAAAAVPEQDEVLDGWMPSARSIAFRRSAYLAAGGYPVWLDVGEDMYLNHRFLATGARMELAPTAVVSWRVRPSLRGTWRQYAGYAAGDAQAHMYRERHVLRFAAYAVAGLAVVTRNRWLAGLTVAGGIAYAARPIRRAWRRIRPGSPERLGAIVGVPAMMAFIDAAKMWGYLRGLASRKPEEA